MKKEILKEDVKILFEKYRETPITFESNKIYKDDCKDFYNLLKDNKGNEELINILLELNYEKELSDFYDILLHLFKYRQAADDCLRNFCMEKIKQNGENSNVILKNIKILRSADIDYSNIVMDYGFFVKDTYKELYVDIFKKSMYYLDFKKWNIDEKEVSSFYINKLICNYSHDRKNSENNRDIVSAIKSYPHSMFTSFKENSVFYNKNMILECLLEEKYGILISLISNHKKKNKKEIIPDTSIYLAMYTYLIARKEKTINEKIFSFFLENASVENLFKITIPEEYEKLIRDKAFFNKNKINFLNIISGRYSSEYKPLIVKLANEKQLNKEIEIQSEKVRVGSLLKKWCKNNKEVFSYIEKWEIEEVLKNDENKPLLKKRL